MDFAAVSACSGAEDKLYVCEMFAVCRENNRKSSRGGGVGEGVGLAV